MSEYYDRPFEFNMNLVEDTEDFQEMIAYLSDYISVKTEEWPRKGKVVITVTYEEGDAYE